MSLPSDSLPNQRELGANRRDERAAVLASHGAPAAEVESLLQYNHNHFEVGVATRMHFPLEDEACIGEWAMYAEKVSQAGSLEAIYPYLPHLQFPIQPGLACLPEYQAAITRGSFIYPAGIATGLSLQAPKRCHVMLQSTGAGRLPVITAGTRSDFVTLIRAFLKKGEPAPIPESMGAVIVGGYNNFHRLQALRSTFLADGTPEWMWAEKFQEIKHQKNLYQDRFVILSPGAYSGVPAVSLHLEEQQWETTSLAIRLEHECAHYFTRRVFGSMQNNLLDELIADFCGLVKATGKYEPDWQMRFLGISDATSYRPGGRLENYRGEPPLSSQAFDVLVRLARGAIANLARFNTATATWGGSDAYRVACILTIAQFTLEELAAADADQGLLHCFQLLLETQLHRKIAATTSYSHYD
jgi:hypothetical protein